jgi:hypothetical protein
MARDFEWKDGCRKGKKIFTEFPVSLSLELI